MKKATMYNPNGGGELKHPLKHCILHAMGEFIDSENEDYHATAWLKDREGTSCHYMVTPSGVVIQTRDEKQVAWHARAGGHNYNSIGIEILVPGLHNYATFLEAIKSNYMTDVQYKALVELGWDITHRHRGIIFKRHSDIDPENKFDPGVGFDWGRFLNDIDR